MNRRKFLQFAVGICLASSLNPLRKADPDSQAGQTQSRFVTGSRKRAGHIPWSHWLRI